ncbi:MAG: OmpA family protein [Phycisphaeraceae bacterium]|nr:OmpA family protein [Phycisphaeraceae bacterium]
MAEKHDEHHDKKKGGHAHSGGHGGGHGGGGHEEHEGAPEWLISFADNVTLMMGFFVIMLAMNMKPAETGGGGGAAGGGAGQPDAIDLSIAVREAFNNPVNLNSMNPSDLPLIQRLLERKGATEIQEPGPRGDDADLSSIRPGDYHQLSGAVPFEDGSTTLTSSAEATLADIASHMRGLRLVIEIRGHVSAAEAFQAPDRAMSLSFERTMTVAKALAEAGLDWKQMRLIAAGDNERLKPLVYDRSGQRRNQRVEVIVTNETMNDSSSNEGLNPLKVPETGSAPAPATESRASSNE